MITSNILNDYNRQLAEQEICYKNNHGNQHDWESINREYISKDIVEILCFCCICGAEKYVYDYLLEYEI